MLQHLHLTESEQKKLLKSLTILIDTREHDGKHDHILEYFDSKNIPYKSYTIHHGDYSFYIPQNEELHIPFDMYFDKEVMIERKANLSEISGNITDKTKDGRSRLKYEFATAPPTKVLLIENGTYSNILEGQYTTKLSVNSFVGNLFSMWHEYNIPIFFMPDKEYSGHFIYMYFYYYLRNLIK